jgi:outer membrane lipoprotein-sorting protein
MKKIVSVLIVLFMAQILFAQDAAEIIRQVDRTMNPDCQMESALDFMENGKLTESYTMTVRARDNNQKVIVRFTSPARQIGNDLIMIDQSVWSYDVKSGRTIKIPSNQAFGATDFSYGDIVRLNMTDNYSAQIISQDAVTWTLSLTAIQREAPYARIEITVKKEGVYLTEAKCFSKNSQLIKTITYSEAKIINGKLKPATITVISAFEPKNISVMRLLGETLKEYPDYIFNKRVLETRQDENL